MQTHVGFEIFHLLITETPLASNAILMRPPGLDEPGVEVGDSFCVRHFPTTHAAYERHQRTLEQKRSLRSRGFDLFLGLNNRSFDSILLRIDISKSLNDLPLENCPVTSVWEEDIQTMDKPAAEVWSSVNLV